jgi:hypothetical protein
LPHSEWDLASGADERASLYLQWPESAMLDFAGLDRHQETNQFIA